MPRLPRPALAALIPLALAACAGRDDTANDSVAALDRELTEGVAANAGDPLLAGALADQIMVDPQLAQRANADAVRPPSQPYSAPIPSPDVAPVAAPPEAAERAPAPSGACPNCKVARESLTLRELAARQTGRVAANCIDSLRYAAGWANRLPKDLPLYPAARVIEAAGSADNGCALRVVSFTVAQPMTGVLDWYYTRARKAGYSADHQAEGGQHVLGGTRSGGGAYVLFLTDRGDGGTDVDMVLNTGS